MFSPKKIGPNFPKTAATHISYIPVLHVITWATLHSLSLCNMIAYNFSGFHALYSNFIQYLTRFVIQINLSC